MIKELYQLEKYEECNIYIYGTNKDSIDTMLVLSIRGIKIEGFLSDNPEYIGLKILNTRIFSVSETFSESDLCIIPKHEKRLHNMNIKSIRYSEIPRKMVNDEIGTKVSIYGAGVGAYKIIEFFNEQKINIDTIFTSNVSEKKKIFGIPVKVWETEKSDNNNIVISVINENYINEILSKIYKYPQDVFVTCDIDKTIIIQGNVLILALDCAIKEDRKILFVDEGNIYSRCFEYLFAVNGIDYEKTDFDSVLRRELYSGRYCIVINIMNSTIRCDLVDLLFKRGLQLEKFDLTSLFYITGHRRFVEAKSYPVSDALTGICINHLGEKNIGWKILGDGTKNNGEITKIMILGNSTSQYGLFPFKSWPEILYERLVEEHNVIIFNASTSADDVVNEYLRLVRDFHSIKPDIVISFSGLTNIYDENIERRFNISSLYNQNINKVCGFGVATKETHYEFWIRIQNMIRMFCIQNEAYYLGVLQHINCCMPTMSLHECMQYDLSKKHKGAVDFYEKNENHSFYMNMIDLFFHKDDMYIDLAHYSEKGNHIIANEIFDELVTLI